MACLTCDEFKELGLLVPYLTCGVKDLTEVKLDDTILFYYYNLDMDNLAIVYLVAPYYGTLVNKLLLVPNFTDLNSNFMVSQRLITTNPDICVLQDYVIDTSILSFNQSTKQLLPVKSIGAPEHIGSYIYGAFNLVISATTYSNGELLDSNTLVDTPSYRFSVTGDYGPYIDLGISMSGITTAGALGQVALQLYQAAISYWNNYKASKPIYESHGRLISWATPLQKGISPCETYSLGLDGIPSLEFPRKTCCPPGSGRYWDDGINGADCVSDEFGIYARAYYPTCKVTTCP